MRHTFLLDQNPDGTRFRARIVEALEDNENDVINNPTRVKFRLSINDDEYKDFMAYSNVPGAYHTG